MGYENNNPRETELFEKLKGTLSEAKEQEFESEINPPEGLSFRELSLFSNWINLCRFLKDVLALHMDESFHRYYLRGGYELPFSEDQLSRVAYEALTDTNPNIPRGAKLFSPWYYSPHAYVGRKGKDGGFNYRRRSHYIARYNALVVDIDGGPSREALEDKLDELGLRPHYFIRTRPFTNNFQLIFKLDPIKLGKGNRDKTLKKIDYLLPELSGTLGGDLKAAKPNQVFRLPYTFRDDLKVGYVVQVIEHSDHPPYDLGEVDDRVKGVMKKSNDTFVRYELEEASEGDVLDSPPVRKLLNSKVRYGYRNSALTALSYAYAMDNYSAEKAVHGLTLWARNHTEGGYGNHPNGKDQEHPEVVIRSCYENPKGLDWRRLAEIETVEGGRIGEKSAKKVLKYMPRAKQIHRRKPSEELKNDRFFMSLRKVLEAIYKLQKEAGGDPVTLKNRELAKISNVSLGTLTNRIYPSLNKLEVKTKYLNKPNKFDLIRTQLPYTTYTFIRQGMYNRSKDRVVSLWFKSFPEEFGRFQTLLDEINEWVASLEEGAAKKPEPGQQPAGFEDFDPGLETYAKMVERHGWDEVKRVLQESDRDEKAVKEAIKQYVPEMDM